MVLIDDNSTILERGDSFPQFPLPATDGLNVQSISIKDPVLAVVFTCNHCPYAQAYENRLIEMANHFDGEGAQFVLINSNDSDNYHEDSFENMKIKHDEKGYPFPYCFDESQEVAKKFGALCTPHCFVFSIDRTLQYKGRIDDNWEDSNEVVDRSLFNAIDALVRGNDPIVKEANAIGCSIKWKE